MDSKHILTSKVFWANIIGFAVSMAPILGFNLDLSPESQTAIVGGCMTVANIILRLVTKEQVHVIK